MDMTFKIDTVNNLPNDKSLLQSYNTISGTKKVSSNFYVVPNEKKDEFVKSMIDKEARVKKWLSTGIILGGGITPLLIIKNVSVKPKLDVGVAAVSGVLGAILCSIPAQIYDNRQTKKILQNCQAEKI